MDPLDDENKVVHVLASLPDSYDMLVTALEASADVPKLEVVTERLLHEEAKRRDKDMSNADLKAMASKHRNPRKGPKCHHCGKIGHIEGDCWELTKKPDKSICSSNSKNRTKPQNAYAAEQEEEEEEIIGLIAKNLLIANRKNNWIVDFGATCHMRNNKMFTEMSPLEAPQDITVGDGYSVEAIAKGTVFWK